MWNVGAEKNLLFTEGKSSVYEILNLDNQGLGLNSTPLTGKALHLAVSGSMRTGGG